MVELEVQTKLSRTLDPDEHAMDSLLVCDRGARKQPTSKKKKFRRTKPGIDVPEVYLLDDSTTDKPRVRYGPMMVEISSWTTKMSSSMTLPHCGFKARKIKSLSE